MTVFDSTLVYITVLGVSAVVIYVFTRLLRSSACKIGPAESRAANLIAIGLVAWPGLAIVYALAIGLSFPTLFPMLAVPWSIGLWLMFTAPVSRILSAMPLHGLVALSFYRVAGAIFLYCYYFCGTLSRGFALNAGWGDVLTGVRPGR